MFTEEVVIENGGAEVNSINVLLVEDDPAASRLVQRLLAKSQPGTRFMVHTAETLSRASERLGKESFDSVLLDLSLPDSQGVETVENIRKVSPQIPIIVLSAYADEETTVSAIKQGADYCLSKGSFPAEFLMRQIRCAVERQKRTANLKIVETPLKAVHSEDIAGQKAAEKHKLEELAIICKTLRAELQQYQTELSETRELLSEKITEHEKLLGLLEDQKSEFHTIFDSMPTMAWYQGREGTILRANRAMADVLNIDAKDLVGQNIHDLFRDNSQLSRYDDINVINNSSSLTGKVRLYTDSRGRRRWLSLDRIANRDEKGNCTGLIVFATDVTQHKKDTIDLNKIKEQLEKADHELHVLSEEAKLLRQEAAQTSHSKSKFLSNMGQQMRVPVAEIIRLSTEALKQDFTERNPETINSICKQAKTLLNIINDILIFGNIETGSLEINSQSCILAKMLEDVHKLLKDKAKAKGLVFEVFSCGKIPQTIITDPARLRQCLLNLVSTSIDTTSSGHVMVVASAHYKPQSCESLIRFDIEDTGAGVDSKLARSILQHDFHGGQQAISDLDETSLKLIITRKLANMLGGEVTFCSEEKKGSNFSLTIDAGVNLSSKPDLSKAPESGPVRKTPQAQKISDLGGSVLIVDDDPANQMLCKTLLAKSKTEVIICRNACEAVELTKSAAFGMILMNLAMPEMDGIEATKQIRANGVTTPVIMVTASGSKDDEKFYRKCGCNDMLLKPFSSRELYELCLKYLAGSDSSITR